MQSRVKSVGKKNCFFVTIGRNLAYVNQCAVSMLYSKLHALQCALHATQLTLHILTAECHNLCRLHCQNPGQEPNSPQGLTLLLEELERSLKKGNQSEFNFLHNKHSTVGQL